MKEKQPFALPVLACIAKLWLRRSTDEKKIELFATSSFILKAEREHKLDIPNGIDVISTFSVHWRIKKDDCTPMWQYCKYIVDHDGSYTFLRGGTYPYHWE